MICLESCGAIPLPLAEYPAPSEVHSADNMELSWRRQSLLETLPVVLVIVEVVDGSNTVGFLEKGRIKQVLRPKYKSYLSLPEPLPAPDFPLVQSGIEIIGVEEELGMIEIKIFSSHLGSRLTSVLKVSSRFVCCSELRRVKDRKQRTLNKLRREIFNKNS